MSTATVASDGDNLCSGTRGVADITRITPPKLSVCLTLPSLCKSGTECERWTPFCRGTKEPI